MSTARETLASLRKNMEKLAGECPEFLRGFRAFHDSILAHSGLDEKTLELILTALAVNRQCTYCIDAHVAKARQAGASRQEILAAAQAAVLMGGGPALMYLLEHVLRTLDDLDV